MTGARASVKTGARALPPTKATAPQIQRQQELQIRVQAPVSQAPSSSSSELPKFSGGKNYDEDENEHRLATTGSELPAAAVVPLRTSPPPHWRQEL
jgi:hypothetical protein